MAVFQVVSNGVDGRLKTKVVFSSIYERDRDNYYKKLGNNQVYYTTRDVVLDLGEATNDFIKKLDGNDKMILNLCLCFNPDTDYLSFSRGDINYTVHKPKK